MIALASAGAANAALTLSTSATQDVTCTHNVCSATAANANLKIQDLQNLLAHASVSVVPGKKAMDIDVAAIVTWASGQTLTLDAYRAVTVQQPITVTGTGGLTVTTNDGGSGGALSFPSGGSVDFWDVSSSLIINGQAFTLVADIATLGSDIAANPSGAFALAADYDASHDGKYKASPVSAPLVGPFEGLGHVVSNLQIAVSKQKKSKSGWLGQAGLFASVGVGGVIADLGVTNAKVSGGDLMNVGIVVAELSGTVIRSYSTGAASVGKGETGQAVILPDVGGLVGAMFGASTVSSSYSTATVTGGGSSAGGGLIGGIYGNSSVQNSYASGNVTVGDNILGAYQGSAGGGLIGAVDSVTSTGPLISGDFASGTVTAGANQASSGGLVGIANGPATIQTSFASGAATVGAGSSANGYAFAGGLIGSTSANSGGATATITQSYATGPVAGAPTSFPGGFIGYMVGTVTDSYATGSVSASGSGPAALGGFAGYVDTGGSIGTSYSTGAVQQVGGSWVGGFVGGLTGTLISTYWDLNTSGVSNASNGAGNTSNAPGVTGRSTAQLQAGLPKGFSKNVWQEKSGINNGLPYLTAVPPPAGNLATMQLRKRR